MKLYRINALMLKYYYITINSIDRIFDLFYWPLIDLIIWGFTSNFLLKYSNLDILSMLLGGTVLWIFVWRSSQDIAVFVLEDFWSRNLYHLFSSPVRPSEHFLSIMLLGFVRSGITFLILSVLAFFVYAFNIFMFPLYFIAMAVFLLTLFGWAVGLFVTGLIFRYGQRIQVLGWTFSALLSPFSCVFYPLDSLPAWASPIARVLPTTYVFEALRAILNHQEVNYLSLVYSFGVSLVLMIIASIYLKKSFEKARESGRLAHSD
jgi:ABC-2 type transport system permease protein